jgi:hypothetical protein
MQIDLSWDSPDGTNKMKRVSLRRDRETKVGLLATTLGETWSNCLGESPWEVWSLQASQGDSQTARSVAVTGHIRVSTDAQAESDAGFATQHSATKAECARRGFDLTRIYEDASASANSLKGRPNAGRNTRRASSQCLCLGI